MEEAKALLKIIKAFLEEREIIVEEAIDEERLYELARKHGMSNFLMDWSKSCCHSEKIKQLVLEDYHRQIIKDTNQNVELTKILDVFEQNGIRTLVVKGVVMKENYPQNYMRPMCDMDILTDEKDFKLASQLMDKLGYQKFYNYEKHLIFTKQPFFMIELHRKLMTKRDVGYEYFDDVWAKCCNYKNYSNIFQLEMEEAYIFCILHLRIHFQFTGISLRDIVDVYLYDKTYRDCLEIEKMNEVFEKLGVLEFEKNIREIAYHLFEEEKIEAFSDVEQFILQGPSMKNNVNYHIGEKKGKGAYLARLFFPEFSVMKEKYPILKKIPFLLPLTWIARIVKDIFSKEATVKTRINMIKMIQDADFVEVEKIKNIYEKLGIH